MGRAVCCICRVLFSYYFSQDLRGLQFQVPVIGVVPDHTDAAGIPGAGSGDTVAHHPLLDLVLGNYHARECSGRGGQGVSTEDPALRHGDVHRHAQGPDLAGSTLQGIAGRQDGRQQGQAALRGDPGIFPEYSFENGDQAGGNIEGHVPVPAYQGRHHGRSLHILQSLAVHCPDKGGISHCERRVCRIESSLKNIHGMVPLDRAVLCIIPGVDQLRTLIRTEPCLGPEAYRAADEEDGQKEVSHIAQ